jgi:hypothetical protein
MKWLGKVLLVRDFSSSVSVFWHFSCLRLLAVDDNGAGHTRI